MSGRSIPNRKPPIPANKSKKFIFLSPILKCKTNSTYCPHKCCHIQIFFCKITITKNHYKAKQQNDSKPFKYISKHCKSPYTVLVVATVEFFPFVAV